MSNVRDKYIENEKYASRRCIGARCPLALRSKAYLEGILFVGPYVAGTCISKL